MGFSMDYFSILPIDITSDILTRLPLESVLDCKLVCKNWKNLIRQLSFSKMHLHRHNQPAGKLAFGNMTHNKVDFHYFECVENHDAPIQRTKRIKFTSPFSDTMLVGSCNGLICLLDYDHPSFCICNPITREYVMLPYFKRDAAEYDHWVGGFGYVSSTNEYKVVGICKLETGFVEVYIYTLGSGNGWRNVGDLNFELSQNRLDHGIFLNGALYWIDIKLKTILTFDLVKEKFCENLLPPPLAQEGDWLENRIGVLDGILFFCNWLEFEGVEGFDTWLLKRMNDNHDKKEHQALAWSKEFRIDEGILFAVMKGDRVFTYGDKYLNLYNTKTSTEKRLVEFKFYLNDVSAHQNTLVSLKELGEEDTRKMES